jgi:hypothetical protein
LEVTIVPHRADLPEALDDRLGDCKYFQQSGGTSADGVTVVFPVRWWLVHRPLTICGRKEGLGRRMRLAAVLASEGRGFRGSPIQKADDEQDTAPVAPKRRIKQHLRELADRWERLATRSRPHLLLKRGARRCIGSGRGQCNGPPSAAASTYRVKRRRRLDSLLVVPRTD